MLDYLGDLGGLYDSLKVIGSVLVAPVSSFNLSKSLIFSLFKIEDKSKKNITEGNRRKNKSANQEESIYAPKSYIMTCIVGSICNRSVANKQRKILVKAKQRVN